MTSYHIATEGRNVVDSVQYKGWSIQSGDWVHVMNPHDPSKPIVAQVWKTFTKEGERLVVMFAQAHADVA